MKKPAGGCCGSLAPTRKRQLRIERLERGQTRPGTQEQAPQARSPLIRDHRRTCATQTHTCRRK